MVTFLMGLQGFTKYPCYLCLWDNRDTASHYKDWPLREKPFVGAHNIKQQPLVKPDKILVPPLHIKLGLMKQFVTALDPNSNSFNILKNTFPRLSEAKIKAGVFVGPDIRKLMANDKKFRTNLKRTERAAWDSFKEVTRSFLGNTRAASYRDIVKNLVERYQAMGCRMSLKVHMLDSHF